MPESIFGVGEDYSPTLYDIVRYAHNYGKQPLIGEEASALTSFLSFNMMKNAVLIKSFSGTGKTVLIDIIMSLIPEAKKYSIQMGSEKSIWYEADKINEADFIEFPELQKTVQNVNATEILKNWGEQKEAKRARTDMIQTQMSGKDTVIETKLAWKPFLTSVAMENKDADIAKAEEFLRRVVQIHTDPTENMTGRVVGYKLKAWATPLKMKDMEWEEMKNLQTYTYKLMSLPEFLFVNPGATALEDAIPRLFPISRSYIDYLKNVVNGVAKFNYYDRIITEGDMKFKVGTDKSASLFIAPQDIWQAWKIYGTEFIESCLKIPAMGREILHVFPPPTIGIDGHIALVDEDMLTEGQVAEKLKAVGLLIEKNKIRPILVALLYSCFLDRDESKKSFKYFRTTLSSDEGKISWAEVCATAKSVIAKEYPDVADDYIERHGLDSESIVVSNPLTGESVDMLETREEDKKSVDWGQFND